MISMCKVFSCVVGRGCLLWPVHFLGKTLLAFALVHSTFQGQICLLLQVFLDFLLLYSSPLEWKGHLFWGVLILEVLREPFTFSFSSTSGWGIDLDYCNTEWFALETNRSFCRFWDCTQEPHFGLQRAWWATVHRVVKSWTWLSDYTTKATVSL